METQWADEEIGNPEIQPPLNLLRHIGGETLASVTALSLSPPYRGGFRRGEKAPAGRIASLTKRH